MNHVLDVSWISEFWVKFGFLVVISYSGLVDGENKIILGGARCFFSHQEEIAVQTGDDILLLTN